MSSVCCWIARCADFSVPQQETVRRGGSVLGPPVPTSDPCPFRLTHPDARRTGCGRLSSAGPRSGRHPTCSVWGFRRKAEEGRGERTDRPTGNFRVAGDTPGRTLRHLAHIAMVQPPNCGDLDEVLRQDPVRWIGG
jgi:hypothetical protein